MDHSNQTTQGRARSPHRFLAAGILTLWVLLALAAVWQWSPLAQTINFDSIAAWERSIRSNSAAPFIIVAAYLLAGFVFFPVMLLTAVTVFTFGPVVGNFYALIGWTLSAAAGYGIGSLAGKDFLRKVARSRLDRLNLETRRNGLLAVLAARVLPVAPFMLVNLFVGASRIRFRDFIVGSLIGRIPGLLALTLFGYQVESLLRTPATGEFLMMAALLLVTLLAHRGLIRQIREFAVVEKPVGLHRSSKPARADS